MTVPKLPSPPPVASVTKSWPTDPPEGSPFTGNGLLLLLNDAAARAHGLLHGGPSGLADDPIVDLARRATVSMPARLRKAMAVSAGTTVASLNQQADAYRLGGAECVHLLNEPPWTPAAEDTQQYLDTLLATNPAEEPTVKANVITVGDVRYKLCHSQRWLRLAKKSGRWLIDTPPADCLEDLL